MIKLHDPRTFRTTKGVRFQDITVPGSNGIDLVEHTGAAISPPRSKDGSKRFYVHQHQTDHNRVIQGTRLFELLCDYWTQPHWWVFLDENTGALEIPPGCFHRSISGKDGSLLLNHAVRDEEYDESKEFNPVIVSTEGIPFASYFNISPSEVGHFLQYGTIQ